MGKLKLILHLSFLFHFYKKKYVHNLIFFFLVYFPRSSSSHSSLSSKITFSVSGNASTSNPANIEIVPQIVVGINQAIEPRKSAIYGADIEPTCAIVELVPIAEFRKFVGNNSAVCKMTTANTALIHVRPNRAMPTAMSKCSVKLKKKKINQNKLSKNCITYQLVSIEPIAMSILLLKIILAIQFCVP